MKIIAKTCRKNQQRKLSTRKDVDREIKDAFKRNSYKMQQSTKKRDVKRKAKILEESKGSEPCTSKKPTRIRKISQCEELVRKLSESSSNRRRKTADEIQLLERCFIQDEEWKRETVEYIKTNSQLTYTQIYKWGWDQKKKLDENQGSLKIPTIDEFGGYCKFQKQSNVSNKYCNEKSNDLTSFPSLKWKLENKDSQIFKESHENKLMVSKINDIDWNKQVQDLDYLCEVEESQSAKVCSERNKIDIQNLDNCKPMMNDAPEVQFSTPKKKSKKDRKSSSITDATNSNKVDENEKEAVILCSSIPNIVAPKIDLYFRDYTYEAYNIDSDDKFCYNSFDEFSERLPENIRENILEFNKSECSELEYSHENLQEKKHGDFIHGLYFSNPHTVMKQCYEDDFDGLFNQHQSHLL